MTAIWTQLASTIWPTNTSLFGSSYGKTLYRYVTIGDCMFILLEALICDNKRSSNNVKDPCPYRSSFHFVWARITIYEIMGSIDLFNYNILSKVFSFLLHLLLLLISVFFDNLLWYILLFYRHHLKSNEYNKGINGDSVHEQSVSQSSMCHLFSYAPPRL